jgi:hypothetical protein
VIGILPFAVEANHWPDPASKGLVLDNLGRGHAAVADALEYLEAHAAYTRLGRNGVRQVEVEGFVST